MKFYSYVKRLADEYGISIHKLEQKTGMTNGTIRRWDTSVPYIDKVILVGKFFGKSIGQMVAGAESYETDK